MAFTTNLTSTAEIDDSLLLAFDQGFITAAAQTDVMDQFVQYKAEIGATSIQFPRYSQLDLATTPLTETEDVTSAALSDTKVILTPAEYGKVVTTTSLASLQSGGIVDLAAATLVGQNLAATSNALASNALLATTNVITAGDKAPADFLATDVLTGTLLNKAYNKLARSNQTGIAGSEYVLFAHDDVIADLRADTSAGSWVDVNKYSNAIEVLRNEVGMYKGFRVIRNNFMVGTDQTGAGTVDVYDVIAMGFNGLGKAASKEPTGVISGPFDKLGRFVNVGWYGVMKYGIIEPDAVWKIKVASSLGNNAA
jgi:N4-gp56 family major capsid protein